MLVVEAGLARPAPAGELDRYTAWSVWRRCSRHGVPQHIIVSRLPQNPASAILRSGQSTNGGT